MRGKLWTGRDMGCVATRVTFVLRFTSVAAIWSLVRIIATSTLAVAAPGDLDPRFGVDGIVLTDIGEGNTSEGRATAIQADGRIIVAGPSYTGSNVDFAVARYDVDGSPDSEFGDDGIVTTRIGLGDNQASDVAVQGDGKIVVAGGVRDERDSYSFAVVRYHADGSLDASFGDDGVVVTAVGPSFDFAFSVAIQDDDKILVAGESSNQNDYDIAVVRYNGDGSLDGSFGDDGIVTTSVATNEDTASSIAIQDDGKIVVTGDSNDGNGNKVVVVRYNPDGSRDAEFGVDGIVITSIAGGFAIPRSVAVQDDGKLVVGAWSATQEVYEIVLLRYQPDGFLDPSFGDAGIVIASVGAFAGGVVTIQGDGKIVATGTDRGLFALVRFDRDGSLDASFGVGGFVTTDVGGGAADVAVQDDGKIVAVGTSSDDRHARFAVVRYAADGSLDFDFGDSGVVTSLLGRSSDIAYDVAIQADAKVVAAGTADGQYALVRYDPDGNVDSSFDGDGVVLLPFDGFVSSVATQGDGKIVVARFVSPGLPGGDFELVRHNEDGSLDGSFGVDGIATTPVGPYYARASDIAVQSDGKLVAAGWSSNGADYDFAVARYAPDGNLDASFGQGGVVTTPIGSSFDHAFSVAVQNDGKIVAAGATRLADDSYSFAVVRYHPDGNLDSAFGSDGRVTTAVSPGYDVANDVVIQDDARIVLAGRSDYAGDTDVVLVRYETDGSLDASFGVDGIARTRVALTSDDDAISLALQGDGKCVVAATAYNGDHGDFAVLRYDTSGMLDSGFAGDGIVLTDLGQSADAAFGIAIAGNGIVVAGSYSGPHGVDFAVARYSVAACGDANGDGRLSATDALMTLAASLETAACDLCVCDVNGSADVTATDALLSLQSGVGLPVAFECGTTC